MKRSHWVIFLLLFGVFANVGIAWVCDIRAVTSWVRHPSVHGFTLIGKGYSNWNIEVRREFGYYRVFSAWYTVERASQSVIPAHSAEELLPGWASYARASDVETKNLQVIRYVDGAGWPFLSLWCGREYDLSRALTATVEEAVTVKSGYLLPSDRKLPHSRVKSARILPLGLLWSGFLLNTIIFATVPVLIIYSLFWIRSLVRIRRGCCPRCGYNLAALTTSGCPECGWRRAGTADVGP